MKLPPKNRIMQAKKCYFATVQGGALGILGVVMHISKISAYIELKHKASWTTLLLPIDYSTCIIDHTFTIFHKPLYMATYLSYITRDCCMT